MSVENWKGTEHMATSDQPTQLPDRSIFDGWDIIKSLGSGLRTGAAEAIGLAR